MLTYKSYCRDMKDANRQAKREGATIIGFEPAENRSSYAPNAVNVTFEIEGNAVRIRGRLYRYEVEPVAEEHRSLGIAYKLTGVRGGTYLACRNRNQPEMLFVMPYGLKLSNPFDGVWLTDKGGTLREVR